MSNLNVSTPLPSNEGRDLAIVSETTARSEFQHLYLLTKVVTVLIPSYLDDYPLEFQHLYLLTKVVTVITMMTLVATTH